MATAPDSNVRTAWQRAARSTRAARRSALARLLLYLLQHVSQLDRRLLVLLAVSPMSACIIPAGPEFQDPLGIQNSPPSIVMVSPLQGSKSVDRNPQFIVRVSDLNLGDTLWIKWITEYPPIETAIAQAVMPIDHTDEGSPVRDDAPYSPNCYQVNRLVSTHQIMAAISDRGFVASGDLLETTDGKMPLQLFWTWQQTCPGGGQ